MSMSDGGVEIGADFIVKVSIRDAIDKMDNADRANLLSAIGMDRWFLKGIVDQLVDGLTEEEWGFDNAFYAELSQKIAEKMQPICINLIREISAQRDQAIATQDRYSDWAWSMYHAWGDGHPRPKLPAWVPTDRMSEEQADALLAARGRA